MNVVETIHYLLDHPATRLASDERREEDFRETERHRFKLEPARQRGVDLVLGRPATGAITSPFGVQRPTHVHQGVDIDGEEGDPVWASAGGRVVSAGRMGTYGLAVVVDHGGGVESLYAHLSSVGVRRGEEIGQGHPIGAVGSTGRSSGSHLHFEVRKDGKAVDPGVQ